MSKVIDAIKFGVLQPDEIRRLSVVEITTSDTSAPRRGTGT
jgi:DNA-directed RNA polymerase beta' subunit